MVGFAQVAHKVAVGFERFRDLNRIFINIAEVLLQLVIDQAEVLFVERVDNFLLRPQHLLQPQNLTAQTDDFA
ncbi:hypothetical protein D3C79_886160 [compost metagenome]